MLPFRGWRLTAGRIGDPATARLFARPYRDVHARLDAWVASGPLLVDDEPATTTRSTRRWPAPGRGAAVPMPTLEFDVVLPCRGPAGCCPRKTTSSQPEPSVGVLMRSLRDEPPRA